MRTKDDMNADDTAAQSLRDREIKTDDVGESQACPEFNLTDDCRSVIIRLHNLLGRSRKHVRLWLTLPHPDFGGNAPLFYLHRGQPEVVDALLEAIETGQIG
ncbi:MAG: hypothetical protein GDA43_22890 [Hormoscilla sp. SP5CHS1]|nr:hypothetical protein [Hormoscilla sp. SP12CHS1]MBC6455675.1 hypothetical protein [Hormoscilla sp. SP5CHS1]